MAMMVVIMMVGAMSRCLRRGLGHEDLAIGGQAGQGQIDEQLGDRLWRGLEVLFLPRIGGGAHTGTQGPRVDQIGADAAVLDAVRYSKCSIT